MSVLNEPISSLTKMLALSMRVDKLEQLLTDFIKSANGRIEKLQTQHTDISYQEVSEVTVFDKFNLSNIKERIEKLESFVTVMQCNIEMAIEKKIRNVHVRIDDLEETNKHIRDKCPVCDGSGGVKHPLTGLLVPATCYACEGKGIVWG